MQILVVDDSEDSRDITEAALLSAGYKAVATAGSAWEAFKHLDIGTPASNGPTAVDIILLDIVMPEVDGIEACARIRNDGRYADIPIIMVTSLADMDSLSNAFVAGANDYITKPINRIELLARVRAALKLKAELVRRQERERDLLNFVSNWGDRRATLWIDDVTGLFVGEVAEAYLTGTPDQSDDEPVSVITLSIDRLDAIRAAQGEKAAHRIIAKVAKAIRASAANLGAVAACYRNGLIVVVAPGYEGKATERLADNLRAAVSQLAIGNRETIKADTITASIAAVSGRSRHPTDRIKLLTQAINGVKGIAVKSGTRFSTAPV